MRICVCLSIGRHPASGRARMAPSDRAALELALSSGAAVTALHVGDPKSPVLVDYLGMGLTELVAVNAIGRDAVPAAAQALAQTGAMPDLILTGTRAEAGEGTGLFPYLLAQKLGWPLATDICGARPAETGIELLQVVPGGRRRRLLGPLPAVLTVAAGALHPRMSTLERQRAGRVLVLPGDAPLLPAPDIRPARKRGARLRPGKGAPASTAGTATHANLSPVAAARLILDTLRAQGLAPGAEPQTTNESPIHV